LLLVGVSHKERKLYHTNNLNLSDPLTNKMNNLTNNLNISDPLTNTMNNLTNNLNLSDPLTHTMNNLTNNLNLSDPLTQEEFEDNKGVIRIRISKNRQHNDQKIPKG
jgi:uncharacterized protein YukJ